MAKRKVVEQAKPQGSQEGRRGAVFALRVTPEERECLQAAADRERESWQPTPAKLGPWILGVALKVAHLGLSLKPGKHVRLRRGNGRARAHHPARRAGTWPTK